MNLRPDPRNPNQHTARGEYLLEQSLRRVGAGRSVVAARDGTLLAGNLTSQKAYELGIPTREVHTDGTELVVVVRDDIVPGSTMARELAIADNRVSEVSLEWDVGVLQDDLEAGVPLEQYWYETELDDLLAGNALALRDEDAQALPADARVRMCVELPGPLFERWTVVRDALLGEGLADEAEVVRAALDALAQQMPFLAHSARSAAGPAEV